jgi:5-methylcytosine-specific restriction enzyme subunit McrC
MKLITHEYGDKFKIEGRKGEGSLLFYKQEGEKWIVEYDKGKYTLKEPLFEAVPEEDSKDWQEFARLLGLHGEYEDGKRVLKAYWFVGITRLPLEDGEIIVQVEPKIEGMDLSSMLIKVLSHPVVSRHVHFGKTYEIFTEDPPIDVEDAPKDFLMFLAIHYIKVLYDLVRRGLQRGYRMETRNLRGRVRGRLLVGRTVRQNWARGKRHYAYSTYQVYTEDTLENRILKAAFLKAKGYLNSLNLMTGGLIPWVGRIGLTMEGVSTQRIYPTDFGLVVVQRIRKDYALALNLAKLILRTLGYDPTVETTKERIRHIYPYWIDMNELFERYVEVKLREGEVGELKGWKVYPGYERGEGIPTDIKELRPDFVFVKDGKVAIGDAKYKLKYGEDWIKEDLQQVALYGRIRWGRIKDWIKENYGEDEKINGDEEPALYIFYPARSDKEKEEAGSFRGVFKIGILLTKS